MAFTVEAYYEQRNTNDVLDRIEVQKDSGDSTNLELVANDIGFRFRWDEITSESNDGFISPYHNRIQEGKLSFFPKIQSSAEQSLVDEILGADDEEFKLVWKRDGSVYWQGYINTRKSTEPESGGMYFASIEANDFDILKGKEYPLDDNRQKLIITIADLLGYTNYGINIKTATSWTESNLDSAIGSNYDFLDNVYHETLALRNFKTDGREDDSKITVYEALKRVGSCGLLYRQVDGVFTVEQITEFEDPSSVVETIYDSAGAVSTATATVDRRQTGYTSVDSGEPVIKNASQNNNYPALKQLRVLFDHRTKVSGIVPDSTFELDSGTTTKQYTQFFLSDGNQSILTSGNIEATFSSGVEDATVDIRVRIIRPSDPDYYWDSTSWSTTSGNVQVDLINTGRADANGDVVHIGGFDISTNTLPSDADGTLEITYYRADSSDAGGFAIRTLYRNVRFTVSGSTASQDSTSIRYQLTQTGGYATNYEHEKTYFGDGPTDYAVSALRYGTSDSELTNDSWQRRGTTSGYRNFHENLLKEILDLQRGRTRKIEADIWGAYEPQSILVYDSQNFYMTAATYTGSRARWNVSLMRVNVQTGSDTFEDLPKFNEGTGTSSTTSDGSTSGGLDQATADDRYLRLDASNDPVEGDITFDIGTDEFRIQDGSAMFVVDGGTGQIGLGAEPLDDVGLLLDTPARAVTDNTDYDRLKVTNSGQLTIAASTTSPIVATAQFDEPNINLASGAAVTNAATIYIEDAPTEGNDNWALYAPSGASLLESLEVDNTLTINSQLLFTAGNEQLLSTDASPTFAGGTFTGTVTLPDVDSLSAGMATLKFPSQSGVVEGSGVGDTDTDVLYVLGRNGINFRTFDGADWIERVVIANNGLATFNDNLEVINSSPRLDLFETDVTDQNARFNVRGGVLSLDEIDDSGSFVRQHLRFDFSDGSTIFNGAATFSGDVSDDGFSEGWAGSGWQIQSTGDAEVESLRVRGALRVYEFIAKQLSSIGGTEILSIANGRIESVDTGAGTITVDNVDGTANTSFKADDLWIVQVVDVNNDLESGGTGSIVKQVRGSVTSVSGAVLTVSVDGGSPDGLADLEQGDLIVAYGSSSDADRQAIMYRNVDRSEDNLIMRLQTGVDAFADLTATGNTAVAYGDLNGYAGISSEEFGFFAGDYNSGNGNFVLATENQVNLQTDTFLLETTGVRISSTDERLSLGNNASAGEITGMGSGTGTDRVIWAGSQTQDGSDSGGTSPNFYVRADGEVFYDGLGWDLGARTETTSANSGNEVTFANDVEEPEEFGAATSERVFVEAARTTVGGDTTEHTIWASAWTKVFGMNSMMFKLPAFVDNDDGGSVDTDHDNELRIYALDRNTATETLLKSHTVTDTSRTLQEFDIDITSLDDDTPYVLRVKAYAEVTVNTDNGTEKSARTHLDKHPMVRIRSDII